MKYLSLVYLEESVLNALPRNERVALSEEAMAYCDQLQQLGQLLAELGRVVIRRERGRVAGGDGTVFYVSGEESAHQVRLRCERLGALSDGLLAVSENFVPVEPTVGGVVDGLVEAERELGMGHQQVGRALAEHWELPETVRMGLSYHHEPSPRLANYPLVAVVHVSDYLAHGLNLGDGYRLDRPELNNAALESLGLNGASLAELVKIGRAHV